MGSVQSGLEFMPDSDAVVPYLLFIVPTAMRRLKSFFVASVCRSVVLDRTLGTLEVTVQLPEVINV